MGGATLGAPLGYAVGGWLAGPGLLEWAERYPKVAAVCGAIRRAGPGRAFGLLALLRLSPVVPYGTTNVLAAVFHLPKRPFVVGTSAGPGPAGGGGGGVGRGAGAAGRGDLAGGRLDAGGGRGGDAGGGAAAGVDRAAGAG